MQFSIRLFEIRTVYQLVEFVRLLPGNDHLSMSQKHPNKQYLGILKCKFRKTYQHIRCNDTNGILQPHCYHLLWQYNKYHKQQGIQNW